MNKGKQIKSLKQLYEAVKDRKAVFCPKFSPFQKPRAAAWIANMPSKYILDLMNAGLYIYKKTKGGHRNVKRISDY